MRNKSHFLMVRHLLVLLVIMMMKVVGVTDSLRVWEEKRKILVLSLKALSTIVADNILFLLIEGLIPLRSCQKL